MCRALAPQVHLMQFVRKHYGRQHRLLSVGQWDLKSARSCNLYAASQGRQASIMHLQSSAGWHEEFVDDDDCSILLWASSSGVLLPKAKASGSKRGGLANYLRRASDTFCSDAGAL